MDGNSTSKQSHQNQEGAIAVLLASCVEVTLCLLGTLGNSLTITAVLRNRNLQVASNFLVASLAFADLLVSVILVPMRAAQHMALYHATTVPAVIVKVAGFIGRVNILASISSLSAMSIDRYIALSHPMHYLVSIRFAKNKVFAVIAIIWMIAILVTSVPEFPGVTDKAFLIFFVAFVLVITFTIAVAYYRIFKIARKASERKKRSQKEAASNFVRLSLTVVSNLDQRTLQEIERSAAQNDNKDVRQKEERKAAKTIAFVIGAFVVLVYPRILLILYHFAEAETTASQHARFWSRILLYSNSVVNPALYGWRHKEFKREFKKILLKLWMLSTCKQCHGSQYSMSQSSNIHSSTMRQSREQIGKGQEQKISHSDSKELF